MGSHFALTIGSYSPLDGAKVGAQKESNDPFALPVVLRLPNSVILKFVAGKNAGKWVDMRKGTSMIEP